MATTKAFASISSSGATLRRLHALDCAGQA
jgi:hypothetical protein